MAGFRGPTPQRAGALSAARRQLSRGKISFDRYRSRSGLGKPFIADPFEFEFAAPGRDREEADERIRRGRGEQIGAKNLQPVVAAGGGGGDVAPDPPPRGGGGG